METTLATVNGSNAMVLKRNGVTVGVVTVAGSAEGIDRVLWVINPAKLVAVA